MIAISAGRSTAPVEGGSSSSGSGSEDGTASPHRVGRGHHTTGTISPPSFLPGPYHLRRGSERRNKEQRVTRRGGGGGGGGDDSSTTPSRLLSLTLSGGHGGGGGGRGRRRSSMGTSGVNIEVDRRMTKMESFASSRVAGSRLARRRSRRKVNGVNTISFSPSSSSSSSSSSLFPGKARSEVGAASSPASSSVYNSVPTRSFNVSPSPSSSPRASSPLPSSSSSSLSLSSLSTDALGELRVSLHIAIESAHCAAAWPLPHWVRARPTLREVLTRHVEFSGPTWLRGPFLRMLARYCVDEVCIYSLPLLSLSSLSSFFFLHFSLSLSLSLPLFFSSILVLKVLKHAVLYLLYIR